MGVQVGNRRKGNCAVETSGLRDHLLSFNIFHFLVIVHEQV